MAKGLDVSITVIIIVIAISLAYLVTISLLSGLYFRKLNACKTNSNSQGNKIQHTKREYLTRCLFILLFNKRWGNNNVGNNRDDNNDVGSIRDDNNDVGSNRDDNNNANL